MFPYSPVTLMYTYPMPQNNMETWWTFKFHKKQKENHIKESFPLSKLDTFNKSANLQSPSNKSSETSHSAFSWNIRLHIYIPPKPVKKDTHWLLVFLVVICVSVFLNPIIKTTLEFEINQYSISYRFRYPIPVPASCR